MHSYVSNYTLTSNLAMIVSVIPMTTCTVEGSFCQIKLVKIRLRNRLGDEMFDILMKISIDGPKTLEDERISY